MVLQVEPIVHPEVLVCPPIHKESPGDGIHQIEGAVADPGVAVDVAR